MSNFLVCLGATYAHNVQFSMENSPETLLTGENPLDINNYGMLQK